MVTYRLLAAVVAFSLAMAPAAAEELAGTLKKIRETGAITPGWRA